MSFYNSAFYGSSVPKAGVSLGYFTQLKLIEIEDNRIGLEFEINIGQRNASANNTPIDYWPSDYPRSDSYQRWDHRTYQMGTIESGTGYIEAPILLKYSRLLGEYKFSIYAGPDFVWMPKGREAKVTANGSIHVFDYDEYQTMPPYEELGSEGLFGRSLGYVSYAAGISVDYNRFVFDLRFNTSKQYTSILNFPVSKNSISLGVGINVWE